MSTEFASAGLTAGQLNAIVKKLGGHEAALNFLRGVFPDLNLDWPQTYALLGLTTEYQEFLLTNPDALVPKPNHWVVPVIKGLTGQKLVAGYNQAQIGFWSWQNDLDASVPTNERHPDNGSYVISFLKTMEADPDLANKSADDLAGIPQITLIERLLLGLAHFLTTGHHLDQDNVTLCAGSRYSGGGVPDVSWGRASRLVCVSWQDPGGCHGHLRSRKAV